MSAPIDCLISHLLLTAGEVVPATHLHQSLLRTMFPLLRCSVSLHHGRGSGCSLPVMLAVCRWAHMQTWQQ